MVPWAMTLPSIPRPRMDSETTDPTGARRFRLERVTATPGDHVPGPVEDGIAHRHHAAPLGGPAD